MSNVRDNRSLTDTRSLRVFVSSTFHDMHAERNELVKRIFPRLRRLCEERRTSWAEVDLRWGVTDEEAAQGKVLSICLDEVHQCRPFFIGILGARYGSILKEIPADVLESEPWLKSFLGRSLTELEIRHGALNDPHLAEYAFFYLQKGGSFSDSSTLETARLEALKEEIRASGLPVRDYARPEDLNELVYTDFEKVILQLWPDESSLDPLVREAAEHAAFARTRQQFYFSRDKNLNHLDRHLVGSGTAMLAIEGEAGAGKSALVANWLLHRVERRQALATESPSPLWKRLARFAGWTHDDTPVFVIVHFTEATQRSADWRDMLNRIIREIDRHLGITTAVPDPPDDLRRMFATRLARLAATGTRTLLVLDGLDRLSAHSRARPLSWMPDEIPTSVRVVVTVRPGPVLEELERRRCTKLSLRPLKDVERRQLATEYLAWHSKKLKPSRMRRIVRASAAGNPLFLLTVLQELRVFGEHDRLDERIDHYLCAADPVDLFDRVLVRLEEDFESGIVGGALALLWAARRGVSQAELLDLLGSPTERLPSAAWSPLYLALAQFLVNQSGRLRLSHSQLQEAVERRYLARPEDRLRQHARLADYFAQRELSERQIEELPWHLRAMRSWNRLQELLHDLAFLQTAWDLDSNDVKWYWVTLEESSEFRLRDAYRIVRATPQDFHQYAWTVGLLLRQTGYAHAARPIFEEYVRHYLESSDESALQAAYGNLAVICRSESQSEKALSFFSAQAEICRRRRDFAGYQSSLGNQGVLLYERGELDKALVLHRQEAEICRELGDEAALVISLCHQAVLLAESSQLDAALDLLNEGDMICRQRGDLTGLQAILGNGASVLRRQGKLGQALALHREEEGLCRQLMDREGLACSLHSQAELLLELQDYDSALERLDEQEEVCREIGFEFGLSAAFTTRAVLYHNLGAVRHSACQAKEARRLGANLAPSLQVSRLLGQLERLSVSFGSKPPEE